MIKKQFFGFATVRPSNLIQDNLRSLIICKPIRKKLARYQLSFLSFIGYLILQMLRSILPLAIVVMARDTDQTPKANTTISDNTCYAPVNTTVTQSSTDNDVIRYDWSTVDQGYVLAAFYYGYVCTQVAGGLMADRYSPRLLFGSGISGLILLSILTPLVAGIEYGTNKIFGIFVLRVIQGLLSGIAIPATTSMWAYWAPPNERGALAGVALSGNVLGDIRTIYNILDPN